MRHVGNLRIVNSPPCLQMQGDIGVFRISGTFGFADSVQRVVDVLVHSNSLGLRRVLVLATAIEGFEAPSVAARHSMVRDWAAAAQGRVRLALVTRPDFIDPERFGVVAAANFGLVCGVFACEHEAMEWLQHGG